MKCPHCNKRQVRRHVDLKTGRWYLYCEACQEHTILVESRSATWRDISCPECGCTMRHDIVKVLAICRGCHRVVEIKINGKGKQ